MNEIEFQMKSFSSNLLDKTDSIDFIWQSVMKFDVQNIEHCWNGKDMEALLNRIYEIDREIKYIVNYTSDVCAKLNYAIKNISD